MWAFLLILLFILIDQATKWLVLSRLSETSIPIINGVFHFTLVKNTGVAFGLLRNFSQVVFIFVSISIFVLFWILFRIKSFYERLAISLIIAGAVGNWIDRFRLGFVVDFLDFRVWPVFNVADSCVTVGVGLLVLELLKKKEK
jgi:signal peptidase II